jgi:hypothetical protein
MVGSVSLIIVAPCVGLSADCRDSPEPAPANRDKETVAVLAYLFWLDRGCPIGSPEKDWFRAEEQLGTDRKGKWRFPVAASVGSTPP